MSHPPCIKTHHSLTGRGKPLSHWTRQTTGEKFLSQLVNVMINTPPLWEVMKFFAKQAIKNTARSKGIDWEGYSCSIINNPEVGGCSEALLRCCDALFWSVVQCQSNSPLFCQVLAHWC